MRRSPIHLVIGVILGVRGVRVPPLFKVGVVYPTFGSVIRTS